MVGDKLPRSLPIPTHFHNSPLPFRAACPLSPPPFTPFADALCRFNPLAGASSFCVLIPPQRGADNLGRGFFKLAPLTRYAARWVSYRNNFRAAPPPSARSPFLFFPWCLFFSPLSHLYREAYGNSRRRRLVECLSRIWRNQRPLPDVIRTTVAWFLIDCSNIVIFNQIYKYICIIIRVNI